VSLHAEVLPAGTEPDPAWSDEAEQNVLALVLMHPMAAAKLTAELRAADFYRPNHRRIFAAAQELLADGRTVDPVILSDHLKAEKWFQECDGAAYLHLLVAVPALVTHAGEYLRIVHDYARKRETALVGDALLAGRMDAAKAAEILRGIDAESSPASPFITALELAQRTRAEQVAVIPPYLWAGMVMELVARIKSGKTTLALAIAWATITAEWFLGRRALQGPVVYLTEQNEPSFTSQLSQGRLLGCPDLHVLFRHEWRFDWPSTAAVARRQAIATGARLVIVDTLGEWARLGRDAENDAGAASEAMRPLHEIAAAGPAVLVLRHERKGGGEIGENARGSSAFGGSADILMVLRRLTSPGHENRRELLAVGRVDVPPKVVIEYEDGEYKLLGEGDELERQEARRRVLDLLPRRPEDAQTFDAILEECGQGTTRTTLHRALEELRNSGTVSREKGTGNAGSRSYGYWIAEGEL
jgi:hypothetical protein